jgi:hypothetical protein
LKEIILVDDASERDYLGEKLEDYVKTLPVSTYGEFKVKFLMKIISTLKIPQFFERSSDPV